MSERITVIGSANRDTVVRVPRIPAPGETVLGSDVGSYRGGKGANQALAAARLGGSVSLIGRVGADADGTSYLRALVAEGVDVDGVSVDIDAPTGQAFIFLADDAENAIAVFPGANGRLSAENVAEAGDVLEQSSVTLAQLEVPLDAVKAAAQLGKGTFVLNPAPAQRLGYGLLSKVDVIVPNRSELAFLVGAREVTDVDAVVGQARRLRGPGAVVVTLGGDGAVLVTADGELHVPSPAVEAVDTTGAGDAFCGALADALARGTALADAVRWAVAAGAAAVTKVGAQTALPTVERVRSLDGG